MQPGRKCKRGAAIRTALLATVAAATARDADEFAAAAATLGSLDAQQLSLVQAAIIRQLLEELHPDGLAGEDVQEILTETVRNTLAWYAQLDVDALIAVLTGALGASEQDDTAKPPPAIAAHACLLIAELGSRRAGVDYASYVDSALAEIERAETIELP